MALSAGIQKARAAYLQLKKAGSMKEANTKASVIQPLLTELGWDLTDVEQVDHEYEVFDGTRIDYALMIDGKPRLFVEAKGAGEKLGDKFIAQTVNYANNAGVPWCVLTNGVRYQVYKSNEPVDMPDKLLFEVDLLDESDASSGAGDLELISREAVQDGRLDDWGERVFTDSRVRKALADLGANPPSDFVKQIEKRMGKPEPLPDILHESLARVLGAAPAAPKKTPQATTKVGTKKQPRKDYPLDSHLEGKPAGMVDLFEQLDDYGQGLGGDVTRRVLKMYLGYYAGAQERSFFTVVVQRTQILIYLSTPPSEAKPWNDEPMRDVQKIGHAGLGDTEYTLRKPEQVEEAKLLIKQAYDRVH